MYLKTQRFRDSLSKRPLTVDHTRSRLLLALCIAARGKKKLTVIDFGGACGAHYFVARAFFADDLELKWNVVETPAMAQMGRTLESDELRFLDSIDEAKQIGKADLVFSSGTLQYVPNPLQTLDELPSANYLFLTRLALLDKVGEGSIITMQISRLSDNGPGPLPEGLKDGTAKYPVTFVEKSIFESRIRAKYRLLLSFEEEDTLSRVGGRMITIRGVGYLAEKPVA